MPSRTEKAALAQLINNPPSLLYDSLGLTISKAPALDDPVLISIDFENISNLACPSPYPTTTHFQMGVAILDTSDLLHASSLSDNDEIISTHNFVAGLPWYIVKARNKFIFGKTTTVKRQDLVALLESLIPPLRRIILVSHNIRSELGALKLLGFDAKKIFHGFLDTYLLSQSILPRMHRRTLRGLLNHLKIPYHGLHSAGNDAHFTLKCLLLLATTGLSQQNTAFSKVLDRRIQLLTQLGLAPHPEIPLTRQEKKKKKRMEKSRKFQAKSWDAATQDRIRAERAAKRELMQRQSVEDIPYFSLEELCYLHSRAATSPRTQIQDQRAAQRELMQSQSVEDLPIISLEELFSFPEAATGPKTAFHLFYWRGIPTLWKLMINTCTRAISHLQSSSPSPSP